MRGGAAAPADELMFVQIPTAKKKFLSLVLTALAPVCAGAGAAELASQVQTKNIAAIVTVYHHNSHADLIVSRLLQTDTLDGKGKDSPLKLVSLYTDQKTEKDISRLLAASHRFRMSETIEENGITFYNRE